MKGFFPPILPADITKTNGPVSIYPKKGVLKPGSSQMVEVCFTPFLSQYSLSTTYNLHSGEFGTSSITINGIGGSSNLEIDETEADFGVLRVGQTKCREFQIRNTGMIRLKYFVECHNKSFYVDPEQGYLDGGANTCLIVKFSPRSAGNNDGLLIISSQGEDLTLKQPIHVNMYGSGGYSDLFVHTKIIDFNIALFKNQNRRVIFVENKGEADCNLVFSCVHPCVELEYLNFGDDVVIAKTKREITIIYTPQLVEKLDTKVFLESSDKRGDSFMVALKGNVGIPRLCVKPEGAIDNLKFNVMRLNKTYEKVFSLLNDGTIFLKFEVHLQPICVSEVLTKFEKNNGVKRLVTNVNCPISATPSMGTVGVGEEVQILIQFTPAMLLEYEYEIIIKYDIQKIVGNITGIGGRVLLENNSSLPSIDFGPSRVGRTYRKSIVFNNIGNLGFNYIVRPEPEDIDWLAYAQEILAINSDTVMSNLDSSLNEPKEKAWQTELAKTGFYVSGHEGHCDANSKMQIHLEYHPSQDTIAEKKFRIFHGERFEEFNVNGIGALPLVIVREPKTDRIISSENSIEEIDIGIHPVHTLYVHYFELQNNGIFPVDFMIEPMSAVEFDVFPRRGYVKPGNSVQIQMYFEPSSENKFQTNIRVLWEGASIRARIVGTGGVGHMEVEYADERDKKGKCLDFGMVPFNSSCEKKFFLMNMGQVGMYSMSVIENEDYNITQLGEIFNLNQNIKSKSKTAKTLAGWDQEVGIYLPPQTGVELAIRFIARSATVSIGDVTIKSDAGTIIVTLRGKGGTISLSHTSDLQFGGISCNYTFHRKITLVNGGSIPSQLTCSWLVVGGYTSEQSLPYLQLTEQFSSLDPRSQWPRHYLSELKAIPKAAKLNARQYWKLIMYMILRSEVNLEVAFMTASSKHNAAKSSTKIDIKKAQNPNLSIYFKRRQMFFHLIASNNLSSQSASKMKPHIRVTPANVMIPSYGEVVLTVDLNLANEDTFLATLVIKSDIPNTDAYEIALAASNLSLILAPKHVNIYCDDTRIINFYRQPIGETELILRNFTNVGHKDIPFAFQNPNSSLIIVPAKGILKMGQTVEVTFAFRAKDESLQTNDVLFEPESSQPIRFKMYGGGGYAKASLARYRRFDFGHCMIGKDTASFLPISNDGNAILHLVKFEIHETDTFLKGKDWPTKRISLFPSTSYQLPLIFNPHEENPLSGQLIIGTNNESYDIELIGFGREAVLIVSKVALEFSECIIGNNYEQRFSLKNIGDVNYPVTFELEKDFPDLSFNPNSLIIGPFSESLVTVSYSPSHETKSTVILNITSPYSTHKIPLLLHAGQMHLEFNTRELDFGMFERTIKPSVTLTIKNDGTVKTSFHIKDFTKPSMFHIVPFKGILHPGKSTDIVITHTQHEVAQFEEKLIVKTDLVDRPYSVIVKGQCEETVLFPDDFCLMNMGICPVLEVTTKELSFTNHGMFPLEYQIKNSYPLKVTPTQGTVLGKQTGTVLISWNPSGGYELRTQIQLITNIGTYQIVVRAKAMFPELYVSTSYVDFGVCASGFTYTEALIIENRGKVPLKFVIPPCKDASFLTSISSSVLQPKDVTSVNILFTPILAGKISSSIIIECRGIHYKEVIVVGMGGTMKLDLQPCSLFLGKDVLIKRTLPI